MTVLVVPELPIVIAEIAPALLILEMVLPLKRLPLPPLPPPKDELIPVMCCAAGDITDSVAGRFVIYRAAVSLVDNRNRRSTGDGDVGENVIVTNLTSQLSNFRRLLCR